MRPVVIAASLEVASCGLLEPQVGESVDAGDAADEVDAAACTTPCPLGEPEAGAPCEGSAECEYRAPDASCSSTFICNGTWSIPQAIATTCDESNEKPAPDCPTPRPLIGSPCATDASCSNYGDLSCTPRVVCRGCMWTLEYVHTCQ